jgi:hypothetical protein
MVYLKISPLCIYAKNGKAHARPDKNQQVSTIPLGPIAQTP